MGAKAPAIPPSWLLAEDGAREKLEGVSKRPSATEGQIARARYLFLNTRLPVYQIAEEVNLHPATVMKYVQEDLFLLYKVQKRLEAELDNARQIEQDITAKNEAAYKSLMALALGKGRYS